MDLNSAEEYALRKQAMEMAAKAVAGNFQSTSDTINTLRLLDLYKTIYTELRPYFVAIQ